MFSNDGLGPDGTPAAIKGWALLLSIFFGEHVFLLMQWAVRLVLSKIESPGLQKERRERFVVRKQYFDESLGNLEKVPQMSAGSLDSIDRAQLEEEARQSSLHTTRAEDRFWLRQRGWQETARIGGGFIEMAAPQANATESKKEL